MPVSEQRTAAWAGRSGSEAAALDFGPDLMRFAAPLISLLVLAAAVASLRALDLAGVVATVPRHPSFWLLFALAYFAAPFAEWVIFRRLWRLPLSGMLPLIRKLIGNEILLGYVGEVYFYAWARRHARLAAAPFGAIKDVTVLSALVGNAVTLAVLAAAVPLYGTPLGTGSRTLLWSLAALLTTSLAAFAWRRRLFSLPRAELRFVASVHLARIAVTTGLTALLWHLALPGVALSWWLLLSVLRLLLSRLPFLPNKDIVFAGIAVLFVGHDQQIGSMMVMLASAILATHVLLGIALMSADLLRPPVPR